VAILKLPLSEVLGGRFLLAEPAARAPAAARGLVVLCALLCVTMAFWRAPAHAGGARLEQPAPPFTLPNWAGQPVSLQAFRGTVVLLDFWASWCSVCEAALPALDAIARRRKPEGLEVLAVNVDGSRRRADAFLAERLPRPAMTLLHDPDAAVLARYGAPGMPALYLIDRDGIVRRLETGFAPARLDEVEVAITALLRAASPSDAERSQPAR
jgi:peroxiredoxin